MVLPHRRKYLTESTNCVIIESMKRIDVLKGIEQILVHKAYETGHISHRADGDWQKTNNGWVRVKSNFAQSTSKKPDQITLPNARKLTSDEIQELQQISDINERRKRQSEMLSQPAPAEEYGEIVKQDFESVPKSIKDKMFTIAQQYKSEWAEDSDEDIRSMAEDDVEAISQMLWDTADEETRNSWLGGDEDIFSDEAYEQDNEDRENMSAQDTVEHLIDNGDYDESFKSIEFVKNDDGEDEPQDDSYFAVADTIMNDVSENYDFDEEDWEEGGDADNLYQYIVDRVIDKAYQFHTGDDSMGKAYSADEIDRIKNIKKSAFRDMRSAPITKNMRF